MTSVRTVLKQSPVSRSLLRNKVPEVTLFFWVIKVLCTTVGESAADYLNINLHFGLSGTSIATSVLLALVLAVQIGARRYIAYLYWLTVTLVSVFGTLVTDNLTDKAKVPLETSTVIFSIVLALVFLGWYLMERTLSIHSIVTRRRESFYWLAILFTFALGTATGDLMAEVLGLGYLVAGSIVAAVIALTAVGWRLGLHSVLSFWIIYILTRPLGASIGDYLAQPTDVGGLDLGATLVSAIFLAAIVVLVVYLAISRVDVITTSESAPSKQSNRTTERGGMWSAPWSSSVLWATTCARPRCATTSRSRPTAAAPATAVTSASPVPHRVNPRPRPYRGQAPAPPARRSSPLGDLTQFRTITQDTLNRLDSGDQSGATSRVTDLETAWDHAQAKLRARDPNAWDTIDGKIDTVLTELRAANPNPNTEKAALTTLLAAVS